MQSKYFILFDFTFDIPLYTFSMLRIFDFCLVLIYLDLWNKLVLIQFLAPVHMELEETIFFLDPNFRLRAVIRIRTDSIYKICHEDVTYHTTQGGLKTA